MPERFLFTRVDSHPSVYYGLFERTPGLSPDLGEVKNTETKRCRD